MREEIIKIANQNRIEKIGFIKARVFEEISDTLSSDTPFVSKNIEDRINPFLIMPNAKSIIVCLFPYNQAEKDGNISIYAIGEDYHNAVLRRLEPIKAHLLEKGHMAECFLDTDKLPERYLAYLAGLGFIGRNSSLINEDLGSFCFIGYILTDMECEYDSPTQKTCQNCGKCVTHCPGSAIGETKVNPYLCASYITQKKASLTDLERQIIKKSGYAWGCDICQRVCPHNNGVPHTNIPEFKENPILNLTPDMAESNNDFKKKFGDRAFSWRGFSVIKRNLEILKEE